MKYVKMLGLLAVSAAALMAFAGSASATTVTSPAGTAYFGAVHAEAEGHAILHNPIAEIKCESTVTGHVDKNGVTHPGEPPVTTPASGPITTLSFGPCTNSWHVTTTEHGGVQTAGTLSFVSNGNGTGDLFSSGATVEATRFGITCRYVTNNTTIGTVTGGTHATLHIEASIPFHSGSSLCGTGATKWTGSYKVTSPTNVTID